ncbi:MAG: hypothetical protein O2819_06595 [Planctomycetota bacterium]|nr:hypothetical protein [Planctomycetota bacterium]MDA1105217.1 hypothetical protein [Planctomycetota bacterium]
MTRTTLHLVPLALTACAALAAHAGATYTYSGPGGAIADAPSNTVPAFTDYSIHVTDSFSIDQLQGVTIHGLAHVWCGDVSIQLLHNGIGVTLVHRVGWTNGSFFGDSSNFLGDYTFSDSATGDLWTAANGGSSSYNIPQGDYLATGLDDAPVSIAGAFEGMDASGGWTLRVGDWGPTQLGAIDGFSFTVTAIPAPGGAALMAVALGCVRRRQRA